MVKKIPKDVKVTNDLFCEIDNKILRKYTTLNEKLDPNSKYDDSLILTCRSGHFYYASDSLRDKLMKKKIKKEPPKFFIAENNDYIGTVNHICPYCGFNKAYEFYLAPAWGDEEDAIRYKCAKCGKVVQEGKLNGNV